MIEYPEMLDFLASNKDCHPRNNESYLKLEKNAIKLANECFGPEGSHSARFCFGNLKMPFYSMGAINSTHLFGLDELLIFSFYKHAKKEYKSVADIGANIGLHSIVLALLGKTVSCFEPDPQTFNQLKLNIEINDLVGLIKPINAAVSIENGELTFTRILGNTTGSHLKGAKDRPYGELEEFLVSTRSFREILAKVDLVKIDVEGHEAEIICSTDAEDWIGVDAIAEIGSEQNARRIFEHCKKLGLNLFSQKNNWERAKSYQDAPASYKEGSAFFSLDNRMPW